ncbi:hypothetical protein G7Y89_g12443 [Cudoniella acicularis]|uniref:Uncharacterized protein n=1 Tax=Cudoniella acicularis TaxID=354080 RepID=A0A8H4VXC7_9HELO|nr:hypothetical protein G7Y89_g12443 [Cudoniella acicularis]
MPDIDEALAKDLQTLDPAELLDTAKIFKKALQDSRGKNSKLEDDLKALQTVHKQPSHRVSSFPSSTSSDDLQPTWIRAEVDCPAETSRTCFRQRSKYKTVIVFDQNLSTLKARSRASVKDELAGIYSRLPSRSASRFHVYIECSITAPTCAGLQEKFWVSTNEKPPSGFVLYCTIHLKRLSWKTRAMIWTGKVKWLYILPRRDLASEKREIFG